jgi:hypothetical protein
MFDPRHDPEWMAAVKAVEPLDDDTRGRGDGWDGFSVELTLDD